MAADKKTSEEAAAAALGGTELFRAVQSSANVKATAAQLATYINNVLKAADNTFTGQQTFAIGAITASKPLTITQTWNNAAVAFKGLLANYTDTASDAGSRLFDFQVNGVTQIYGFKGGHIVMDGTLFCGVVNCGNNISANTLYLMALPTANPASAGAIWNDGGTLKISAG